MIRLPRVLGLIFCERMEVDRSRVEVSLIGLFQSQRFTEFPSPPLAFTVYSALYDGVGEGTMKLSILRLETEEWIYSYTRWFTFPGRQRLTQLELKARRCVFPAPGRYRIVLSFDKHRLAERLLDVYRS